MVHKAGMTDRITRILVGEGLVIAACFLHGIWRWLAAPGLILMLSPAVATCLPLRIRTNIDSDQP